MRKTEVAVGMEKINPKIFYILILSRCLHLLTSSNMNPHSLLEKGVSVKLSEIR